MEIYIIIFDAAEGEPSTIMNNGYRNRIKAIQAAEDEVAEGNGDWEWETPWSEFKHGEMERSWIYAGGSYTVRIKEVEVPNDTGEI